VHFPLDTTTGYAVGNSGTIVKLTWNPPSFTTAASGDGRILWNGGGDDGGRAVIVLDDGKILAAGSSFQGGSDDFAVWRYNTDGTPDVSFGGGAGVVFTDFSAGSDSGKAMAIQSDGKIVVAGQTNNDCAVARYESDGSLDTGFGTGGRVTTDLFGGNDVCQGVAVQSDGKIVVSGTGNPGPGGQWDYAVIRYNSDGSLDLPFGGSGTGIATADVSGGNSDLGQTVVLQPDGKILVGGRGPTLLTPPGEALTVVRFNTDGSLDTTTFNAPNGYVAADIAAGD